MTVETGDVEVVLGRDLTDSELGRVGRLIELAEGLIESSLPGFSIAVGSETATVYPGDPDIVWTPRYPVTSLTSVAVDGTDVDASTYSWDEIGRVRVSSWPPLDRLDFDPLALGTVALVYNFGGLTDDVSLVVASMVAATLRRQTNVDGVQSETLGPYQVSYGDWAIREAASGMTIPDGALKRWKRTPTSAPLARYR